MTAEALAQLRAGLALLAQAPEEHLVRRCLEHHEPLDQDLQCPKCPPSTAPEFRPARGRGRPKGAVAMAVRWEVFNAETGEVVSLVLGDFRIEWHEEPRESRARLAGRDRSGIATKRGRKVGRWRPNAAWAPWQNRVESGIGRPNRKKKRATAA